MADISNFNSGDSSAYNNQYPVSNNANVGKVNSPSTGGESEYSHSWRRAPRPFGLNVRVPQAPVVGVRTQNLIRKTIVDIVSAPVKEVIDYFKTNEKVFNGSISAEIESLQKQQKITVELLQDADEIVMTDVPSFMMDM
ncbi:hypothetical protein J6O48_12430 [bacterium]|nr:hypothetical protein [bacterium]